MSFTYDLAQLESEPLYQVRFRLGDTQESTAVFQDEEITYALGCNNDAIIETCIDCISALLPRLAQQGEFKVGPYTEKQGAKSYDFWSKLLGELKAKATTYNTPIMMPPTSPPIFHYDMMEAPGDADNSRRYI